MMPRSPIPHVPSPAPPAKDDPSMALLARQTLRLRKSPGLSKGDVPISIPRQGIFGRSRRTSGRHARRS